VHDIAFGQYQLPSLAAGMRAGRVYMPFSKIDRERRIVWGVGQTEEDKPDSQNDIVDFEGTIKAFKRWAGNVREMHGDTAAGHAIQVLGIPGERKILVGTHVSKGAQPTWEKVLDGTLRGYSIGGRVLRSRMELNKATGKKVHRILDYELDELSLVDTPANASCIITAVMKRGNALIFSQTGRKAYQLVGRKAIDL
jgi:hypothetical protein